MSIPIPTWTRSSRLMADGLILPYLDVPLQHGSPRVLKRMRRPAAAENTLERIFALARDLPRADDPQHLHRRLSRRNRTRTSKCCSTSSSRPSSTVSVVSPTRRSTARGPTNSTARFPSRSRRSAGTDSCRPRRTSAAIGCSGKVGTRPGGAGRRGRTSKAPSAAARRTPRKSTAWCGFATGSGWRRGNLVRVIVEESDDYDLTGRLAD